ncbi:MAG: hypothetical protein A2X18_02940 [Bacteroidetes bacterium GWF2_40_14]|nr:MAG: hypothetical protein A2X18_02940 [Bacteroidetes bacterium GWF2_40_14]
MKNIYKIIFSLFLIMTTLLSCQKSFLEIIPKGKLVASKTSDYDFLLNSISLTQLYSPTQLGDEVAAMEPYFSSNGNINPRRYFTWEDDIYDPGQDASEITVIMRQVYTYNMIINGVMNAEGGSETQKKSILAEARVGRSSCYFSLVNFYVKPYTSATASTDLGFPIITEADASSSDFIRPTSKEVYDFIIQDLTKALPDLPQTVTHRYRASRPAAEAMLAKVYVFMGKFTDALPLLNSSISTVTASTVIPIRLYDYNVTFASGGIFLPISSSTGPKAPTYNNFEETFYYRYSMNNFAYLWSDFVLNNETKALFSSNDLRLKFTSTLPAFASVPFPNGIIRRLGFPQVQMGVHLPDLYLLRAECKARLNDLPGAKSDVEILRSKRMPAADVPVPVNIATNKAALVKYIFDERIREYFVTGHRWFDMRRLSVDPEYSNLVKYTHTVYNADGSEGTKYTLKPERLTMRFNPKLLEQNPRLVNNP